MKAQNFNDLLEDPSENRSKILARIEKVGKGRFAQRLAGKLEGQTPPAYIKKALQRVIDLVSI